LYELEDEAKEQTKTKFLYAGVMKPYSLCRIACTTSRSVENIIIFSLDLAKMDTS
jgi:hypothetical protein